MNQEAKYKAHFENLEKLVVARTEQLRLLVYRTGIFEEALEGVQTALDAGDVDTAKKIIAAALATPLILQRNN